VGGAGFCSAPAAPSVIGSEPVLGLASGQTRGAHDTSPVNGGGKDQYGGVFGSGGRSG
jgi:hypothetical protein